MVRMQCAADLRLSAVLPNAQLCGGPDVTLGSCTSDARRVQPGDIFVPLVEAHGDGHDDVSLAVARGASAIVAERLLPASIPVYVVDDTREALGHLCQQVVSRPSYRMCTLGVAGSHGKTTTALLLASVLRAAGGQVGWATSLGTSDGIHRHDDACHDWGAPELARRLAGMEAAGCQAAILEVDGPSLANRRSAGIAYDAAIITNFGQGTPPFHGNRQNHRRALRRLLDQLKPDGLAVLNLDDPATEPFLNGLTCQVLTVGIEKPADVSAAIIERHVSEQTFLLTAGSETISVRTYGLGDHHVMNCLGAAAIGLALGIDLTTVVRGIEMASSLPGRLERIECGQPFGVFVDGGATMDRLSVALRAVRRVTAGRVICVYGPDGRAPRAERPLHGRLVERLADYGIVTGNNPGIEPIASITDDVVDGYRRPARAHVIPDRRRAIEYALSMARPGDALLITGKGERQGHTVGHRTIAFDDRELVRRWLRTSTRDRGTGVQVPLIAEDPAAAGGDDEPIILRMFND